MMRTDSAVIIWKRSSYKIYSTLVGTVLKTCGKSTFSFTGMRHLWEENCVKHEFHLSMCYNTIMNNLINTIINRNSSLRS